MRLRLDWGITRSGSGNGTRGMESLFFVGVVDVAIFLVYLSYPGITRSGGSMSRHAIAFKGGIDKVCRRAERSFILHAIGHIFRRYCRADACVMVRHQAYFTSMYDAHLQPTPYYHSGHCLLLVLFWKHTSFSVRPSIHRCRGCCMAQCHYMLNTHTEEARFNHV